ncbi:MAG TPA: anti-sigma factor [Chloroflexota bacterium]|nr:anti-sigma factor [Chloroflexota bacterium]
MATCELIADLGEGYALGVLGPEELDAVERHADACPRCREVLDRHVEVAALLALAVPQREPPQSLARSLMAAARGDTTTAERQEAWWRRALPGSARIAWGLASFASLLCSASLAWALNLESRLQTQPAMLAPAASVSPSDYGGMGPGFALERAQMHRLVGSDAAPEARGWIYTDPQDANALLVAYKLPPLPPDKAYQLWLVTPTQQRYSGGVFSVDAEGYGWLKIKAPATFGSVARVGITVEPRAGSPGPTGQRVLGGDL